MLVPGRCNLTTRLQEAVLWHLFAAKPGGGTLHKLALVTEHSHVDHQSSERLGAEHDAGAMQHECRNWTLPGGTASSS
ncbi:hypothetical protein CMQ_7132 [Grosmannia clavigera kw1407]|uniref:Uncharacterized protein n=1 Tax=Grosmannia clavigera (strain kw1407 / UAMH 11150) TaxID=655863 RepID=F0XP57_GROCL|nr:uncharacterized protein CMQ_7132 [Grosmannia clavigera kw1407]EFX00130.1 hypothetical protein CMQ_7132 [Grosmannia clavigera kw1407]